jgi:putative endonuclease
MHYTYLARCNDNSLYTGITDNILAREKRHNAGHGSKYTRSRLPVKIIYFETFATRAEAAQREYQIKGWTKVEKENLIIHGHPDRSKKT